MKAGDKRKNALGQDARPSKAKAKLSRPARRESVAPQVPEAQPAAAGAPSPTESREVEFRIPYAGFTTGGDMSKAAHDMAKRNPEKLDLATMKVRKEGLPPVAIFTFKKQNA